MYLLTCASPKSRLSTDKGGSINFGATEVHIYSWHLDRELIIPKLSYQNCMLLFAGKGRIANDMLALAQAVLRQ